MNFWPFLLTFAESLLALSTPAFCLNIYLEAIDENLGCAGQRRPTEIKKKFNTKQMLERKRKHKITIKKQKTRLN